MADTTSQNTDGFSGTTSPFTYPSFDPGIGPINPDTAGADVLGVASTIPGVTDGGSDSTLGDIGSILGDLGNIGGSVVGSPLGQLGELYGLYSIIQGQGEKTQTQNDQLAGQISAIGQPLVSAGQSELGAYTAGTLTGPFQTEYQTATQQNAQQATSQEQQLGQMLAGSSGGQNMTGALASGTQQIEGQKSLADQSAMSNAFLGELNASLGLTSAGGQYVQSGITQEIASNTQLQQQLSQLMGALAEAYGQSQGAAKAGGSATGSIGSIVSGVGSLWNDVSNLFGFNAGSALSASTAAANAAGAGLMAAPEGELGALADEGGSGISAAASAGLQGLGSAAPGTGAAALAEGGADAAAGAGAAGALGAGLTSADAIGLPTAAGLASTMPDVTAGAAGASSAGLTGALGALGTIALPAAILGGIGYGIASSVDPSQKDNINQVSSGQTVGKTPGGNSMLQQGSVGYGVGGDSSKGSGVFYQMNNGQITATLSPQESLQLNGVGQAIAQSPDGVPAEVASFNTIYQYAQDNGIDPNAYGDTAIGQAMQLYAKYGGQQGWGEDFSTWLTGIAQVTGNTSGNLNTTKLLGP